MTKQEYLNQLQQALAFLDDEARDAAVDFYTEMLEDRLENCPNEAQAVAEMETADSIAARLRAENARREAPVSNPDSAKGEYEKKTLSCPAAALTAIRLRAQNKPIIINPCEGDAVTLTYYTNRYDPYTAGVEDGVLYLRPEKSSEGGALRTFGFHFSLFGFSFSQESMDVTLSMPKDLLVDLTAETSNDGVELAGFTALCDVTLRSSNARIDVRNVECKSLLAKTSNSRVILESLHGRRFVSGETSNARLCASQVCSDGDLTLTTSNARVEAQQAHAAGKVTIRSSNGSLRVEDVNGAAVSLRTSNAAISGTLPGAMRDWAIESKTSNGHNSLPKSQPGEKPLEVQTSNAGIKLGFAQQ